nr:MAG TPA: hypothetical protein [Bacteriophage sp.]
MRLVLFTYINLLLHIIYISNICKSRPFFVSLDAVYILNTLQR